MSQDPPVLDYFPSKFNVIQNYGTDDRVTDEGASSLNFHPFQIIQVNPSSIVVAPGTINNHYAGPAGVMNCSVGSSLSYLVLDVNAGTGGVSSASLEVRSSAPNGFEWKKNSLPGSFDVLLAAFSSSELYQLVKTNLYAEIKPVHTQIKQSISLGEYDSDIWYQWKVS